MWSGYTSPTKEPNGWKARHRTLRILRPRSRSHLDPHPRPAPRRLRLHTLDHRRGLSHRPRNRQRHRIDALSKSRAPASCFRLLPIAACRRDRLDRVQLSQHRSPTGRSTPRSLRTSGSTFSSISTARCGLFCRRRFCGARASRWRSRLPDREADGSVRRIYAANTLGAILGALGASLLLVAWVGSQRTEQLLIALSIGLWSVAATPAMDSSRAPWLLLIYSVPPVSKVLVATAGTPRAGSAKATSFTWAKA